MIGMIEVRQAAEFSNWLHRLKDVNARKSWQRNCDAQNDTIRCCGIPRYRGTAGGVHYGGAGDRRCGFCSRRSWHRGACSRLGAHADGSARTKDARIQEAPRGLVPPYTADRVRAASPAASWALALLTRAWRM